MANLREARGVQLDRYEASALSRLFSAGVFRDFAKHARSPRFARLLEHTRIPSTAAHDSTVGEAFDAALSLLVRSRFRDDYVYRSAITGKILLGRHSLNTATLLSEVRAGSSKADVVVLNGTSTAYEIKSERDSLTRLRNQICNYRRVFATVNVVVGRSHLSEVLRSVPQDVGVITLSERSQFRTEREALTVPDRTLPTMILDILRVGEAAEVLDRLGHEAPSVPNTRMRLELTRIYSRLDPTAVHNESVRVLKRTRSQSSLAGFVRSVPESVRAASLAARPDPRSRDHIMEAVATPLVEALAWK